MKRGQPGRVRTKGPSEVTKHPDVHTPWRPWSEEQIFHVAVAYSHPVRWASRRVLLNDFPGGYARQRQRGAARG